MFGFIKKKNSQQFIILLGVIIMSCNLKEKNNISEKAQNIQTESKTKLTGKEIVEALEKLNFFNLTDESELEDSKKELEKAYTDLDFFEGKLRGESMIFTDNRFYFIDSEELFEVGGITSYLDIVKISFDKLDLKLNYTNETSIQTSLHWTHKIELNGKEYTAYDNDFSDDNWEISYLNFIEMLNDQLKLQGSFERFYPISSANDGRMVLLSPEQFEFVKRNYPNDENIPKTIYEWKN